MKNIQNSYKTSESTPQDIFSNKNISWKIKKLGEVCEIINRGISPKYTNSEGICVLNQKCIRDHKVNFDLSRTHDLTKKIPHERFIQVGDVLVNSTGTGTLGRVAQIKELPFKTIVDSHITILRPKEDLFYFPFFGYALIFIEEEISKRGEGCGGQTELARNTLKNDFSIFFPDSHIEQQRIAAILDKTFAAIAKAKENTEKNLKNANAIFESKLQNLFTELYSRQKKLGEVSKLNYGYTQKALYNPVGPKFLRITDIQENSVNWELVPFCKINENQIRKYQLNDNDIVFARTGATTGKSFLIKSPPPAVFASYLIRLKILDSTKLIPEFLLFFFQTNAYWKSINAGLSGSAQGGFNASKLSEIMIPLPSVSEQQRIIIVLNELLTEIKKLKFLYEKKENNLDDLKKSILQIAFTGKLSKVESPLETHL